MEKTSKIKYGWLVTAMVVVLLVIDQIIKVYIKTHFCLGESVRVTDWFYIEFVENNGMAWGMSFIGKFWLSLLRLVAICALSIYLHRIIKCGTYRLLYIILVALVLTGAIGNMIDSIFYGLIFTGASPYYVSYLVPFGEGYAPVLMGKVVDMFRFPFFTYLAVMVAMPLIRCIILSIKRSVWSKERVLPSTIIAMSPFLTWVPS
jgi:signal peptidase II